MALIRRMLNWFIICRTSFHQSMQPLFLASTPMGWLQVPHSLHHHLMHSQRYWYLSKQSWSRWWFSSLQSPNIWWLIKGIKGIKKKARTKRSLSQNNNKIEHNCPLHNKEIIHPLQRREIHLRRRGQLVHIAINLVMMSIISTQIKLMNQQTSLRRTTSIWHSPIRRGNHLLPLPHNQREKGKNLWLKQVHTWLKWLSSHGFYKGSVFLIEAI